MTEIQPRARERTVEVSPGALARICPEVAAPAPRRPLLRRVLAGARMRLRLLWARAWFDTKDFRTLRCVLTRWRLRARLIWLRLRHRGRLSP